MMEAGVPVGLRIACDDATESDAFAVRWQVYCHELGFEPAERFPDRRERDAADLRSVLFPGHFGTADLSDEGIRYYIGHVLDATLPALEEQVRRCLWFACAAERAEGQGEPCVDRAASITRRFIERLPAVRELLGRDLDAVGGPNAAGDPARVGRGAALVVDGDDGACEVRACPTGEEHGDTRHVVVAADADSGMVRMSFTNFDSLGVLAKACAEGSAALVRLRAEIASGLAATHWPCALELTISG